MKKIIIALAVCLASYILFGLSVAILGTRYHHYGSSATYPIESGYGLHTIFDHHITGYDNGQYSWTVNNDFPNIHINSAGANTIIEQWDGENISIEASVPNSRKINISACYTYNDSDLYITVTPPNVSFIEGVTEVGIISWLEDIFSYSGDITVTVKFPKYIYESLHIQQGSGTLSINELYAHNNDIDIGSGTFTLSNSANFTADYFNVDLGSGSADIKNMQTGNYSLDIGSGVLGVSGLTGYGSINMGSGKCNVVYSKYGDDYGNGAYIDMGSGTLSLYLPENSGFTLKTSIGSGVVDIDALGVKERVSDDKTINFGDGSASMYIDMGSGKVNLRDSASAPLTPATSYIPSVEGSIFSSSSGELSAEPIDPIYGEVTVTDNV